MKKTNKQANHKEEKSGSKAQDDNELESGIINKMKLKNKALEKIKNAFENNKNEISQ